MATIFLNSLGRLRGQILGWGLSLAVLGAFLVGFYDSIASQQTQLLEMMRNYPPELMAMFGGMEDLASPAGFLNTEFFSYMPLIVGIFTILIGSGLLVGDEENGTLDLVLAHPVSRTGYFWGRLLAFSLAIALILVITWVGFIAFIPGTTMDISASEMLGPFLVLFAFLFLIGTLSLLLSMLLPSRRLAATTAGMLMVATFFLTAFATLDENLEAAARFSPMNYYQGAKAINGVNWEWLIGLFGFGLLFSLLAWWLFQRRDIRVGGEGGWGIPRFARLRNEKLKA
jgi:ABC-2 type transport system permease protein